jgi:hypothetical protein
MLDSGGSPGNCNAALPERCYRPGGQSDTVDTVPVPIEKPLVTHPPSATNATASSVVAPLTFLVPSGAKPRVVMPADPAGRIERSGIYHSIPIGIHDARHLPVPPTIDREGFARVRSPTKVAAFLDAAVVERCYYAEVAGLLVRCTGATAVHVFDHTVRAEDDAMHRPAGLRQPVAFVHNDYTEQSAPQRVRDFFPPREAERLLAGRIAFVNVWRPIGTSAERFPLAAADGRSVSRADYVAVDMIHVDRIGEIYHCAYSSGQRWFYFADMQPDEVMLLKCFDSATDGRTRYTAHTGFANPFAAPGTPPRRSIEVRTILSFASGSSRSSPHAGGHQ